MKVMHLFIVAFCLSVFPLVGMIALSIGLFVDLRHMMGDQPETVKFCLILLGGGHLILAPVVLAGWAAMTRKRRAATI